MWLDNLAEALVNLAGKGFDETACQLPAFKPKQENRAALPKKEKKLVEIRDNGLLTDDEMLDWRYYGYGERGRERVETATRDIKTSKAVVIELDETPEDMHGITEREFGEMKAYIPPLNDLELAAKVKAMRGKKTLAEIAGMLGEKEQLIRHYSSALGKANPYPRKK